MFPCRLECTLTCLGDRSRSAIPQNDGPGDAHTPAFSRLLSPVHGRTHQVRLLGPRAPPHVPQLVASSTLASSSDAHLASETQNLGGDGNFELWYARTRYVDRPVGSEQMVACEETWPCDARQLGEFIWARISGDGKQTWHACHPLASWRGASGLVDYGDLMAVKALTYTRR